MKETVGERTNDRRTDRQKQKNTIKKERENGYKNHESDKLYLFFFLSKIIKNFYLNS